jgi:hypothetical protein
MCTTLSVAESKHQVGSCGGGGHVLPGRSFPRHAAAVWHDGMAATMGACAVEGYGAVDGLVQLIHAGLDL